jgi:hypothetical protein
MKITGSRPVMTIMAAFAGMTMKKVAVMTSCGGLRLNDDHRV